MTESKKLNIGLSQDNKYAIQKQTALVPFY